MLNFWKTLPCLRGALLLLLTASWTVAQAEETYSLISKRGSGDVDLIEKTFDAAGTLLLEIDPNTHVSKASPGREQENAEGKKENKTDENSGENTGNAGSSENVKNTDSASGQNTETLKEPLIQKIPMKVTSKQKYEEMLIQSGNLLQGETAKSTLGAWYFLENETTIQIDKTEVKPQLDLNQPLIGVDISNAHPNFFRKDGFLTRDELDVINVQGNTLLADYFLPNRDGVKIGDSWKQSPDTMGILLQMDLVFNLDIKTKLAEVKKNIAILETSGWLEGSYEGNTSKIEVTGKAYFDLTRGRVVWFGLVIQEKRTAGFISPGMDVTAKIQYKITPQESSKNLTPEAAAALEFDPAQYGLLLYQDPRKVWQFVLSPEWEPMNQNEFQSNFRLIRDGQLVAQCTVNKVQATTATKNIKPEDFAEEIKGMLKEQFDSILDIKTQKREDGSDVIRVDVAAKYEGISLRIFYYLITKGEQQYTIVFTLEDNLLENFGELNETMVQSFTWMK